MRTSGSFCSFLLSATNRVWPKKGLASSQILPECCGSFWFYFGVLHARLRLQCLSPCL